MLSNCTVHYRQGMKDYQVNNNEGQGVLQFGKNTKRTYIRIRSSLLTAQELEEIQANYKTKLESSWTMDLEITNPSLDLLLNLLDKSLQLTTELYRK